MLCGDRTVQEAIEKDTDASQQLIADAQEKIDASLQLSVDSKTMKLSDFSTEQLIDRILTQHHTYLKAELPILSELMFKILTVHGENHTELFTIHKIFGNLKN